MTNEEEGGLDIRSTHRVTQVKKKITFESIQTDHVSVFPRKHHWDQTSNLLVYWASLGPS